MTSGREHVPTAMHKHSFMFLNTFRDTLMRFSFEYQHLMKTPSQLLVLQGHPCQFLQIRL